MHLRKWDAYRVFLILSGASALLFNTIFTLNLVYQAQVVGLTPLQLVLVGTTLEAVCFLFEIPTGIVADLYSRRLSVIIGFFLYGLGFMVEGLIPQFWAVLLTQVIWGIGATFTSGALEAWIVDEVGEDRMGDVFMRGSQVGKIFGIVGIILSVVLGSIALRLPVLVGGSLFVVLAVFLVAVMPETGFKPTPRGDTSRLNAMVEPLRQGAKLVRRRPMLLNFIGIGLVLGIYSEGFDRLWQKHVLTDFGLPSLGALNPVVWFGIINVAGMILTAVATEVARRHLNTNSQKAIARMLMAANALMVAGLVVFALGENFWLALVGLLVFQMLRGTSDPIFSTWTNQHIDSNVRATMLSSFGQVNAIGQIAGGPVVGAIGEQTGLRAALTASGVLLAPVVWLIGRASRHSSAVGVEAEAAVAVEAKPSV